jgi:hypothetical protein
MGKLSFQYRPSDDRGGADHGWLKVSGSTLHIVILLSL